jgi:periplasmic copper chaperone A
MACMHAGLLPQRQPTLPRARRPVLISAITLGLVAFGGVASAHVTVSPTSAAQGSTTELTFKVPNEESNADTVELQLQIPTRYPIAQLLAKPVPGWTITEHTINLAKPLVTDDGSFTEAVDEVDWTGGSIAPGQYQDFSISVDPLPTGTGQLVFKAVQTYSDGDVVRWIDLQQPGQPEPDHPAPVLTLTAAGASSGPAAAGSAATAAGSGSGSSSGSGGNGDAVVALWLGGLGLAAGLAALALTLLGRRRDLAS